MIPISKRRSKILTKPRFKCVVFSVRNTFYHSWKISMHHLARARFHNIIHRVLITNIYYAPWSNRSNNPFVEKGRNIAFLPILSSRLTRYLSSQHVFIFGLRYGLIIHVIFVIYIYVCKPNYSRIESNVVPETLVYKCNIWWH